MRNDKLLNPAPVRLLERDVTPPEPQDTRPFWQRLLFNARPMADVEKRKRDGKVVGTLGVKTHVDF